MVTMTGLRMINITLIFGLCAFALLLTGCVSQPSQPRHTAAIEQPVPFETRKAQEEQAWAQIGELSRSHCGVTGVPPRETAVAQSSCVSELIYNHVLPVAVYPALVRETRNDALEIAKDYSAGKMTTTQYQSRSVARLRNYKNRWNMLSAQARVGFVQTVHAHQRKAPAAQRAKIPQPVKTAQR